MNLKEFGLRLQKLRLEHHLSQEYLAEEIGCSKGAISFYELGKSCLLYTSEAADER